MVVVEADTSLAYEDAKTKCEEVDPISYPAVPYNEYLQDHLKNIIDNSSLTEDAFWIGCRNTYLMDHIINDFSIHLTQIKLRSNRSIFRYSI